MLDTLLGHDMTVYPRRRVFSPTWLHFRKAGGIVFPVWVWVRMLILQGASVGRRLLRLFSLFSLSSLSFLPSSIFLCYHHLQSHLATFLLWKTWLVRQQAPWESRTSISTLSTTSSSCLVFPRRRHQLQVTGEPSGESTIYWKKKQPALRLGGEGRIYVSGTFTSIQQVSPGQVQ